MAVEARRGCGYRKMGGLYLVSSPGGMPCDRLPFPLTVCPVCSCGIKQARGFTWVNPAKLMGGQHSPCMSHVHQDYCPVCKGSLERAGLLWVGGKFYKRPDDFLRESETLGVSRRINALPRGFVVGETWILLAHPEAVRAVVDESPDGEQTTIAEALAKVEWQPGIIQVWKPQRLEKIMPESARESDEVKALEKRGITPVFVPDNDKDHQGSVHDSDGEPELELTASAEA